MSVGDVDRRLFDDWWDLVLGLDARLPLARCVFCDLETTGTTSMLAWWTREEDNHKRVLAAGMYHNRDMCGAAAETMGFLWDVHCPSPRVAWAELSRIAWTYDAWDASALLRMVRIVSVLSQPERKDDADQTVPRPGGRTRRSRRAV